MGTEHLTHLAAMHYREHDFLCLAHGTSVPLVNVGLSNWGPTLVDGMTCLALLICIKLLCLMSKNNQTNPFSELFSKYCKRICCMLHFKEKI